jgi:2-(1,2-epoxy-1,2-dihydrophenyl)acetyl-CoA isomerase
MPYETILFDVGEGVATITLNRPDKLNCFTAAMHAELRDALARVQTPRCGHCCSPARGAASAPGKTSRRA